MTHHDIPAGSLAELARSRHSCRAFRPEPLEEARLETMLRLAQLAPSDCNSQPWQVYLIGGARLDQLRETLTAHVRGDGAVSGDISPEVRYEGVHLERRRACGWGLYEAVGITRNDRAAAQEQAMENFRFFGAPHLALITAPEAFAERGTLAAGIYIGYLLLAAEACGIAAVPQAAPVQYVDVLRSVLPIPSDQRLICAVALGTKDEAHPANQFRTERADPAAFLHRIE